MQRTVLKVRGMTCQHCVANVTRALQKVSGVSSAKVDLESQEAVVEYDPARSTMQDMAKAVEKAGYSAVAEDELGGDGCCG